MAVHFHAAQTASGPHWHPAFLRKYLYPKPDKNGHQRPSPYAAEAIAPKTKFFDRTTMNTWEDEAVIGERSKIVMNKRIVVSAVSLTALYSRRATTTLPRKAAKRSDVIALPAG
jgi:hypothetical protein